MEANAEHIQARINHLSVARGTAVFDQSKRNDAQISRIGTGRAPQAVSTMLNTVAKG